MRRTASEVLRNLEIRVARLEKKSKFGIKSNVMRAINAQLKSFRQPPISSEDLDWNQSKTNENRESGTLYLIKGSEYCVIIHSEKYGRQQSLFSVYSNFDEADKDLRLNFGDVY